MSRIKSIAAVFFSLFLFAGSASALYTDMGASSDDASAIESTTDTAGHSTDSVAAAPTTTDAYNCIGGSYGECMAACTAAMPVFWCHDACSDFCTEGPE